MPTIGFPAGLTLAQLRNQARELHQRLRAGDPSAERLATEHAPDVGDLADVPLPVAEVILAHSYGFSDWARLVDQLAVIRSLSRSPGTDASDTGAVDVFLRHAVLRYCDDDGPARWSVARDLVSADPSLSRSDIYAASASADHRAAGQFLAADGSAANRPGGPLNWQPLLYLTYARCDPEVASADVMATASVLLESGADPNAGFLWDGLPTPFTALTGVLGSGERGVSSQPPHPHAQSLARLLLDAGADPNDGQALYNRMFSRDNSHLDLLFACGLGAGDGGPWHRLLPEITDSPAQLVRGQLAWAVCHGIIDRIVLLARHGVDLSAPFDQGSLAGVGRTPVALAMTCGRPDIAVLLGRLGAANVELDPATRLVGALLAGDEESAGELIQQAPGLLDEVRAGAPSLILRAAVAGSRSGVELLLDNGFDVNAKGRQDLPIEQEWETALHYAAGEGDLDLVQMLLGAGADPNVRDTRFDATPLGWAVNFGKSEVASRLRPVTRT